MVDWGRGEGLPKSAVRGKQFVSKSWANFNNNELETAADYNIIISHGLL